MLQRLLPLAIAFVFSATCVTAEEKATEDPTKITTEAGMGYTDEFAVSGSLAFGPVAKINARVTESGQWMLGGSSLSRSAS